MKKKINILKTAGLLELTGPFSIDDTSAKKHLNIIGIINVNMVFHLINFQSIIRKEQLKGILNYWIAFINVAIVFLLDFPDHQFWLKF